MKRCHRKTPCFLGFQSFHSTNHCPATFAEAIALWALEHGLATLAIQMLREEMVDETTENVHVTILQLIQLTAGRSSDQSVATHSD